NHINLLSLGDLEQGLSGCLISFLGFLPLFQESFRHKKVKWQLDISKSMLISCHLLSCLYNFLESQIYISFSMLCSEASPGSKTIRSDFSFFGFLLTEFKGFLLILYNLKCLEFHTASLSRNSSCPT